MNVAVYCSAKDCIPKDYLSLGDQLGVWLAEQGHELVYGGATGGLMSRVSRAYQETTRREQKADNRIIGVAPQCILNAGRKSSRCDEFYEVGTMSERKQKMRELADCFICLPGSYGTLDEMMDVISSGIVGEHHKPLLVLNHDHYYDDLQAMIANMHRLAFLPEEEVYKPIFVNTLDELYGSSVFS